MRKRFRKWIAENHEFLRKHRILIIALLALLSLVVLFSGTKIYLFVNLVLGNDVVVRLETEKTHFDLDQGEQATVDIKASIITNPFCRADCSETLADVSAGRTLAEESFTIRPGDPFEQEHSITAPEQGHGVQLYRFSMTCQSHRTLLCHTSEEPVRRDILITAEYDLSDDRKELQARLQRALSENRDRIGALQGSLASLQRTADELPIVKSVALGTLENHSEHLEQELRAFAAMWNQEAYEAIEARLPTLASVLDKAELEEQRQREQLVRTVGEYNVLLGQLSSIGEELAALETTDSALAGDINATVTNFNTAAGQFAQETTIGEKQTMTAGIAADAAALRQRVTEAVLRESLERAVTVDILHEALCLASGPCASHPSAAERAETPPSLRESCAYLDQYRALVIGENVSGYIANATLLERVKNNVTQQYLAVLSNETYADDIRMFLAPGSAESVNTTENLTAAVVALAEELPDSCVIFSFETLPLSAEQIGLPGAGNTSLVLQFETSVAACCLFGACNACCEDCRDENYPVVFVHGHAFNKDTLADYSLHAFNSIQERLEEDGYVNAGTVSLYTEEGDSGLGRLPAPVSVKVSYYFDIFQAPESYVTVQTKTENIDTYAIRLKELVDSVRQKTGKDKVAIVAHSMGGLVSRRYMQIFGAGNVDRLVMIGTPNKGIVGSTAGYCSLIGEQLECRDMGADSLFINKLNRQPLPDIPIYTIVGTGCEMDGGDGDGIVLAEHAALEGSTTLFVQGSCSSLGKLHTAMLDIRAYPEVYDLVLGSLG